MAPAKPTPPGRRWWTLALVAVLGLGMLRCSLPTDIGVPQWDIPFAVSFNTERYALSDLVEPSYLADSGYAFVEGEDGVLTFMVSDTLDTVRVQRDDLLLEDHESVIFNVETDTLVFPPQTDRVEQYSLDDAFTSLGLPTNYNDGDQVPLPDGWEINSGNAADIEFDELDSVEYAHIIDGRIALNLNNDTDITFNSLKVEVLRQDINDNTVFHRVVQFNYGDVLPGQSIDREYFLTDDTLTSNLRMRLEANGDAQTITANHADALQFTMDMDTLKADFAEAVVGHQAPKKKSEIIYLDDDFWVKRAIVDSGYVEYRVVNQTHVNTMITLTFPQVYRDDGDVPYDTTFEMERVGDNGFDVIREGQINIAGMRVRYPSLPEVPGTNQEFLVQTTVEILGSGEISPGVPDTSLIDADDAVISRFTLSNMILRNAEGVPRHFEYDIEEEVVEISQFEGEEQLQNDLARNIFLQDVDLVIQFVNNIEAPMSMTLDIEAYNTAANMRADTSVTRDIGRRQTEMRINNIASLVNIMPDRISITGNILTGYDVFGVPDTAYVLNLGDYIQPSYYLEAPISYVLTDDTPLRPPVQAFEEPLNPDVARFNLLTIVANNLPAGGYLYLMAGRFPSEEVAENRLARTNFDQYGITFLEGMDTPTPVRLEMPPLDENGRPLTAFVDTVFTIIPESRLNVFSKDSVYTRQVLVLEASGDTPVVAKVNDYVDVTVVGEVVYHVN